MNVYTELIKKLVLDVCLQHHAKLLHKKYAKLKDEDDHPLFGLCYYASEAYFHLLKGSDIGIKGAYKRFTWRGESITHWVVKMPDGVVVDITNAQFCGEITFDYSTFKGCGFQQISGSARFIINEVEKRLILV
tara:strand:- start:24130 stop:24528 length:399 start_codon:yes stop_codon:yes gene_type:complete